MKPLSLNLKPDVPMMAAAIILASAIDLWRSFTTSRIIEISAATHDVEISIAYATADNFTGKPVYARPGCYLHADAAARLETAIALARQLGYRFKVFDAFRPAEAQWVLWDEPADLFDFASVEMDQPSLPILLFVDESWPRLCEVDAVIEPESPQFDAGKLRTAIETQIADEGLGERILKTYLERRAESAELEEEEGEERPGRGDDD